MTAPATRHKMLRFGEFELDETRGALLRGGSEIHLRRQAFGVLQFLAANAGRLVSKDEIFEAVWGKTVVTDDSLTQCLVEIRRALGDESREAIRTVPRRGYVFEYPVEEIAVPQASDRPLAPDSGAASRFPGWLLATIGIAFAVIAVWWMATRDDDAAAGDVKAARADSIAVLAFADMSEGRDHEYFAEGISEEILNLLTRIPGLRVVARTSSFSFKEKDTDIATIGKALDVEYVLEGSVRRSGNQVRVTTQLIDAADSSHLWSQIYDRELGDLLTVQTEIAEAIARTLEIRLTDTAIRSSARAVDPLAHEHYLHARFLWSRRPPGGLENAQRHLERAVEIDPGHAPAWALLSGVAFVRIWEDGRDPEEALAIMARAIENALALAPESGEVQARAAQYYLQIGDLERSRTHWERAVTLEPDNLLVLGFSAGLAHGRNETAEAVEFQRRAVQLDPVGFVNRLNLSGFLEADGQYEEAWRELLRARELAPDPAEIADREAKLLIMLGKDAQALAVAERLPAGADREMLLALAYGGLGRAVEAEAALQQLHARPETERASRLARVHAWRGEHDMAFSWLARAQQAAKAIALTPGERVRPMHVVDSGFLHALRKDPRFEDYLSRSN